MTPSVQNLNAKLSPRPRATSARVAATNRHLTRNPLTQPVSARAQIGVSPSGYRGGYRIDV